MAKEELALLKEIDHAQEREAHWYALGNELKAKYEKLYGKKSQK